MNEVEIIRLSIREQVQALLNSGWGLRGMVLHIPERLIGPVASRHYAEPDEFWGLDTIAGFLPIQPWEYEWALVVPGELSISVTPALRQDDASNIVRLGFPVT